MATKYYLDWQEVNTNWEDLGNPWKNFRRDLGEEKAEKFIKLFCKINGMDYEEVVKPKSKIKVKVEHFKRVFDNVPNIKIRI